MRSIVAVRAALPITAKGARSRALAPGSTAMIQRKIKQALNGALIPDLQ
jgi:hypothetical protein